MARDYPKTQCFANGGKVEGVRDPTSHRTPAQMHKMSRGYNHTPEQIHKRSMRNAARRTVKKDLGAAAIKGKDVDHKHMLKNGGSNSRSNLRVISKHKNRGWERDA